jgi:hypothetical protein
MMGGMFVVETSANEERARVLKDVSLWLVIRSRGPLCHCVPVFIQTC